MIQSLLCQHDLFEKPVAAFPDHALERCSAAKLEFLNAVILTLGERNRVVEAQRTERRRPDQADTDRGPDDIAVVILQTEAGARICRSDRRLDTTGQVDLASLRPRGRALIIIETAGVGIDRALEPDFLR